VAVGDSFDTSRLNRALEEVEKYKAAVTAAKERSREELEGLRKASEKLAVENKKLLKQRNDLMNAFRKQVKLIDILRRQKVCWRKRM
jgi:hypothetical protein